MRFTLRTALIGVAVLSAMLVALMNWGRIRGTSGALLDHALERRGGRTYGQCLVDEGGRAEFSFVRRVPGNDPDGEVHYPAACPIVYTDEVQFVDSYNTTIAWRRRGRP